MAVEIRSNQLLWVAAFGATLLAQGCASDTNRVADPRDPLETYNRFVYRVNQDFDKVVMRPVAEAYQKITPEPVDRGITNFFDNLADVTSVANNILQFKMSRAGSDVGRIFINSTVGVLGFIDVATNVGLPSYKEDFGQTLGYWGVEPGAYFMLPFLGPSTIRDTIGRAGDVVTDPLFNLREHEIEWGLAALRVVDDRADLLTAGDILDAAALDPYSFVRDAYLQRRLNLVYDGNPPTKEDSGDIWNDVDFGPGPSSGDSPQSP